MGYRLIELDWPRFGEATVAPEASLDEFRGRIARTRLRMEERRLTHLVVYADREHFANLAWLTRFDPRFEEALLVLRPEGRPVLLTGNECRAYLPVSPLWRAGELRTECFQPFSLLDQPRDASREMQSILAAEAIGPTSRVGCAGWKYYGEAHRMDAPSYLVDTLRGLAGFDNVCDATDLFVHPGHGLRTRCSAAEIAFFEYSNGKASGAMRRIHFALRCGMTDHELLAHARYDGLPLSCHMTLKTGPNRISLASPSGNRLELGQTWSANIAYWGSNICRAGWIVNDAADLPAPARGYVDAFAGPYFEAMTEWLGALRIGRPGGDLHRLIQDRLPFDRFHVFLNAGHLIHLDEWVSSPVFPASELPIASGMVMQTDVIPSSPVYFSSRMEDGVAIADAALRAELRARFPECLSRCLARRRFVEGALGIALPEELLPLSNMACLVPPFLLRPNLVFARG